VPGALIGGAAAETAGVIPGLGGVTSAPAAGVASTGPVAPASGEGAVKESRLQTSLREYLVYKQLNKKVRR